MVDLMKEKKNANFKLIFLVINKKKDIYSFPTRIIMAKYAAALFFELKLVMFCEKINC